MASKTPSQAVTSTGNMILLAIRNELEGAETHPQSFVRDSLSKRPAFHRTQTPFLQTNRPVDYKSNSHAATAWRGRETLRKFQFVWDRVIMFCYTNPKNNKNMTNPINNDADRQKMFSEQHNFYLNNLCFEEDPIEQFFNEQAFLDRHSTSKHIQQSNDLTSVHQAQDHSNQPPIDETPHSSRKKSIFHNFQKHLITLIKKFVILLPSEGSVDEGAPLKYGLWGAFKRTRCFNKKVLHMVFGVSQSGKAEEEMRRLAQEYAQFRPIFEGSSVQEILLAQAAIREEVLAQSTAIGRAALQGSCNVNRFEEFYEYFQSFLCELASGPMAKRMTKNRKYVVVERLKNKQKCE